jgi:hypothetical protein
VTRKRRDHEPPPAIARRGWKFHHLGIPTNVPHAGERHLNQLKLFVRGFDTSPFGVEWMRFEPGCQISEIVRTVPHIAFEVKNLERALKGFEPLGEISSPSRGTRVAMIVHDGAPIELIEFSRGRRKARGRPRVPTSRRARRNR